MDRVRAQELAGRLTEEDRQAILNGNVCFNIGPREYKPRTPKPAPPHAYRACRIYTAEGLLIRCSKSNCQDQAHVTKAALGFVT
jgi:hypothetical protein